MAVKREFNCKYVSLYQNDKFGICSTLRVENNIKYLLDTEFGEGTGNGKMGRLMNDIARYTLKFFRRQMDFAVEFGAEWKKVSWFLMNKNRENFNENFRDEIGKDNDDFFHLFYYGIQETEITYNITQLKKNFNYDERYNYFKTFGEDINEILRDNDLEQLSKIDVDLQCMFYCLEHCKASDFKEIREIRNSRDIMRMFSQIVLRKVKYKMKVTDGC